MQVEDGRVAMPALPGIGFQDKSDLHVKMRSLAGPDGAAERPDRSREEQPMEPSRSRFGKGCSAMHRPARGPGPWRPWCRGT